MRFLFQCFEEQIWIVLAVFIECQRDSIDLAWHSTAMFGCSTSCPKCKHEFKCCPTSRCRPQDVRRTSQCLSGGGLVATAAEQTYDTDVTTPCRSPQVSPSVPLAFVMPQPTLPLIPTPPPYDHHAKPEMDLERLGDTVRALRLSGWFYEGITYQQSHELLKDTEVGTFLVRNSSDPRFLFSLSVQTERGPTSVRLYYQQGYFRLDAQPHLLSAMPMFPCVLALVEHYVNQSKVCKNNSQVWVDYTGKWYSPIELKKPFRKGPTPPSLKHLARLAINKELQLSTRPRVAFLSPPHAQLELPKSLTAYLEEYLYSL
ncbi:suppressor of cytokine signaling 2-like isoform X2 [Harmonia axyridis]|uniref:suppressor of cytokine signaling 2-like isoform X2 n=1 Tax=Harmonia axyridis TaxID=115357 RepID=UPI001E27776B|nr:suppressor of cytokine signaling 2-like isoform X2 [Harmonia axyridis]